MTPRADRPDPYATTPAEVGTVLVAIGAVITTACAITCAWPFWITLLIVTVGAPLAGLGAFAVLGRINRARRRLRVQYDHDPRPALYLVDTPRPGCPYCLGEGGRNEYHRAGEDPEDGETWFVPCGCWTDWRRQILPVPRRLALAVLLARDDRRIARRADAQGYSDEPPF